MKGPVGGHDLAIAMLERYGHLPSELAHEDPDFVAELITKLRAELDAREYRRRRRLLEARMRERAASGLVVEDADLSEIV